jgi:pyrimidine deaminase RibD-like protein
MTINGPPGTAAIVDRDDSDDDEYFMRKALEVAQRALKVGEVPVGCVVVLDKDHPAVVYKKNHRCKKDNGNDSDKNFISKERCGVIISHGANQVNATRDATRHAEVVAIDRLLTDGVSSDQLRLPPGVNRKGDEDANNSHRSSCKSNKKIKHSVLEARRNQWEDRWVNDPSHPGHWTNSFGWKNNVDHDDKSLDQDKEEEFKVISRDLRSKDIFRHCQLYVTCEVSKTTPFKVKKCVIVNESGRML